MATFGCACNSDEGICGMVYPRPTMPIRSASLTKKWLLFGRLRLLSFLLSLLATPTRPRTGPSDNPFLTKLHKIDESSEHAQTHWHAQAPWDDRNHCAMSSS